MKLVSITGYGESVGFQDAILKGKAEDNSLYAPITLPAISKEKLASWQSLTYKELAFEVLSLLIPQEDVPSEDLQVLINESFKHFQYPDIIPHKEVGTNLVIQELFHGPTLSFKDVAMNFVVNLFDYFLDKQGDYKTLMVATSGDTGPAAAFASHGKANLRTWVFYPGDMISPEQRRQMTTLDSENVFTVCVRGCPNGSDDLDELINACYADSDFRTEMQLSSVNSINWGRVMMQTVHYFWAYLQRVKIVGESLRFAVPAGAFGNLCAGFVAYKMGLPVERFIVCSNANGVLSEAFNTGILRKREVINTLSNAIDIAVPMNFWRYLYFDSDFHSEKINAKWKDYEQNGKVAFEPPTIMYGETIGDEETAQVIKEFYSRHEYLLDPHGAVAVAGALRQSDNVKTVCLATAHPSKFPSVIEQVLGTIPREAKHPSIIEQESLDEHERVVDYASMVDDVQKLMRG